MKFIDMHCDTLLEMYKLRSKPEETLGKNSCGVDFESMKRGGSLAQFFAIFLASGEAFERYGMEAVADDVYIKALHEIFTTDIAANAGIISFARSYSDLQENEKNGKMSAFLTFEDGRAIDGSLDKLKMYYDMGIRLITLTWNAKNCFGSPTSDDPQAMKEGLTDFGHQAVERMNELGMIVDVSHLSDGGFWDVVKTSKKPFIASHSNARALSPHRRNISDDMIKALANAGGCAGICFAPQFLDSKLSPENSTVKDMVTHALHIKNVGGIECVAIGSDLDGTKGNLEINDIAKMPLLLDALKKAGFTDAEVEAVAYGNALRVIKESMK
ncbi:MAG: dipeptidase [Spirochaetes bacterium]|nr:dipeptidase [Spirochaetota bacterium]